jgi:hypothetical protein
MTHSIIRLFHQSRTSVLAQLPRHSPTSLSISRIDDPHGSATIVAVRGTLDRDGLVALWDTAEHLSRATSVHLDLHNTTIPPGPWMAELEALGEALETAGLRVRIVGIDPTHPDIAADGYQNPSTPR